MHRKEVEGGCTQRGWTKGGDGTETEVIYFMIMDMQRFSMVPVILECYFFMCVVCLFECRPK